MIVTVGIIGYTGRMGQAIAHCVEGHASACLGGGLLRGPCLLEPKEKRPRILTENPDELFPHCDVLIDFSHPSATPAFARVAALYGKPFMSGTTGLGGEAMAVLRQAAETIPVLYAANTSLSMAVLRRAVQLTARLLKDQDYDVSISEKHHRWKKDAPSGTALALGESVVAGNDGTHAPAYTSVRAGSIVGEHDVLFAGQGENILMHHHVTDRKVFAQGALHAALWLATRPAGFYSMDDVLGTGA